MDENQAAEAQAIDWSLLLNEEPDDLALRHEFEKWLSEKPAHAIAWKQVSAISDIIRSAPPDRQVDPVRPKAFQTHIQAILFFLQKRWKLLSAGGVAAAACCAALLLIVPDLMTRLRADQYAPTGTTRTLHLADGSDIVLAPRSAISIWISAQERHIDLLQGEAFFTVHHESGRSFIVQAGKVRAQDIGTAFDIQIAHHKTTVRVQEGVVHVGASTPRIYEHDLHGGEWARVSDTDIGSGTLPSESVGAWKEGELVARNDRVGDMITALRPWSRKQIVVMNHALLNKRVTGVYDLRKPDTALRLIVSPLGGKIVPVTSWANLVISP
ncbi:two component sensor histidine kinase FecR/PupR [Acetobacter pasteurianus NBRC 3299]|nr:histidine kinase [Acetobacter pasteurianus]GCD75017.1 two component sensor histidine kinase FecR/PupR [Acetobacter pasteurianus NBRC 3299]